LRRKISQALPEELVALVYRAVLGREPDPEGFAVHVSALRRGGTLEDLLKSALDSNEFRDKVYLAVRQGKISPSWIPPKPIPDMEFYAPVFSPWEGHREFAFYYKLAASNTVVSRESCYVLYQLALQSLGVKGDFWECGVYKGGTARMLAEILFRNHDTKKRLCLFDTFEGMPDADPDKDFHKQGDFADTSLAAVKRLVGHEDLVSYYAGVIPDSFSALESSQIALAHIDVDIYKSVLDCCKFIFPRLSPGGFMVFDDYGLPSCPGARAAVDEYFLGTGLQPLVLATGQAVVFKSPTQEAD
jgi:O-methyltransferase